VSRQGYGEWSQASLAESRQSAGFERAGEVSLRAERPSEKIDPIVFDWPLIVSGVIGVLLGVVGTGAVSARLNREAARRETRGAIWVVATELDEASRKIAEKGHDHDRLREALMLGDWLQVKTAFAGLSPYDSQLRDDVARTYGEFSEFISNRSDDVPKAEDVSKLVRDLHAAEEKLAKRWTLLGIPLT
jgi:hypothetical protein